MVRDEPYCILLLPLDITLHISISYIHRATIYLDSIFHTKTIPQIIISNCDQNRVTDSIDRIFAYHGILPDFNTTPDIENVQMFEHYDNFYIIIHTRDSIYMCDNYALTGLNRYLCEHIRDHLMQQSDPRRQFLTRRHKLYSRLQQFVRSFDTLQQYHDMFLYSIVGYNNIKLMNARHSFNNFDQLEQSIHLTTVRGTDYQSRAF